MNRNAYIELAHVAMHPDRRRLLLDKHGSPQAVLRRLRSGALRPGGPVHQRTQQRPVPAQTRAQDRNQTDPLFQLVSGGGRQWCLDLRLAQDKILGRFVGQQHRQAANEIAKLVRPRPLVAQPRQMVIDQRMSYLDNVSLLGPTGWLCPPWLTGKHEQQCRVASGEGRVGKGRWKT